MSERENSGEAYRDPRIQKALGRFRTYLERSDVPALDYGKYSGQPPLFDMSLDPVFIKQLQIESDHPKSPVRTIDATYYPPHVTEDGEESFGFVSINCETSNGYYLIYCGNLGCSGVIEAEMHMALDDILADGPALVPDDELLRRLRQVNFWDALSTRKSAALRFNHPKEILAYSGGEHTLAVEPGDVRVLETLYSIMVNNRKAE